MLRFWKNKKKNQKEIQDKVGDPFLIQDDRLLDTVGFSLNLLETPEIRYSISTADHSIHGSYEIYLIGNIVKGPKKLIDHQINIKINEFSGMDLRKYEHSQILGFMGIWEYEKYLDIEIKLSINDRYAADILKYLYEYKPSIERAPLITIAIKNERRYNEWPRGFPCKDNTRKIIYDVVNLSCWYKMKNVEE